MVRKQRLSPHREEGWALEFASPELQASDGEFKSQLPPTG